MSDSEKLAPLPTDVVLDTCVIVDLLIQERPRHETAKLLAAMLGASGCTVFIPAHAWFEIVSALLAEHHRKGAPQTFVGRRSNLLPFNNVIVAIDEAFVTTLLIEPLLDGVLIDVAGGDMIFAALALKHGMTLISEDEKLLKRAKKVGVSAVDVETYMRQRGSR